MEVFKLWIRTLQLFKTGVAIKKGFLDIDRPFLSQLISSEPDFLCYFRVTSKTSFQGDVVVLNMSQDFDHISRLLLGLEK